MKNTIKKMIKAIAGICALAAVFAMSDNTGGTALAGIGVVHGQNGFTVAGLPVTGDRARPSRAGNVAQFPRKANADPAQSADTPGGPRRRAIGGSSTADSRRRRDSATRPSIGRALCPRRGIAVHDAATPQYLH